MDENCFVYANSLRSVTEFKLSSKQKLHLYDKLYYVPIIVPGKF